MARHSTVGFGLSAAGAWGTGVALDLAGGPQTSTGWAFVVLALGISLGPLVLSVVASWMAVIPVLVCDESRPIRRFRDGASG